MAFTITPDTMKTALSIVSPIVSVISAVSASVSARHVKLDTWNVKRDALVLQIVANQTLEEALSYRAGRALVKIQGAPSASLSAKDRKEQSDHINDLSPMSTFSMPREYNAETIDELTYSKESKTLVDKVLRGELSQNKMISSPAWETILTEAERFAAKL